MMPKLRVALVYDQQLARLFTDLMIVSVSRGTMVRRSISSALMPSFCSCRTAFSALMVIMELVTTVISALRDDAGPAEGDAHILLHLRDIVELGGVEHLVLKEHNGSLSRMAVLSNPLHSPAVEGTTTLTPGMWAAQAWMDWEC